MSSSSFSDKPSSREHYESVVTNIINYNAVGFALLMAKETGVLDILLKAKSPVTSKEIADLKGLKERYTQELLAALVVVRLVKAFVTDEGVHVYHLEQSAKDALENGVNLPNTSRLHIFVSRYSVIKQCMSKDGPLGVAYSKEFDDFITELNVNGDDKCLEFILTTVPEIKERLEDGIKVLEFASGNGSFIAKLAEKFPNSHFTASEVSDQYVTNMASTWNHVPNLSFKRYDMCALPGTNKNTFDWMLMRNVTHVIPYPGRALKAVRKLIEEKKGLLTILDFVGKGDPLKSIGNMRTAMAYTFSLFNCIPASFQREDSEAHGCCWSQEICLQMLHDAKFEVETFPYTYPQLLFVCKPI